MKFTKETLRRTTRTFLQAFISAVCVTLPGIDFGSDKEILRSALISLAIGGVSAGIAAVMNLEEGVEE